VIALDSHRAIQEPSARNFISKHSHTTVTACCNLLWNLFGSDHSLATRHTRNSGIHLTVSQYSLAGYEPNTVLMANNDTLGEACCRPATVSGVSFYIPAARPTFLAPYPFSALCNGYAATGQSFSSDKGVSGGPQRLAAAGAPLTAAAAMASTTPSARARRYVGTTGWRSCLVHPFSG